MVLVLLKKKIVSVNSVGTVLRLLSWDSNNSLMGLEQQPEDGLCFWKPCFAYCYED